MNKKMAVLLAAMLVFVCFVGSISAIKNSNNGNEEKIDDSTASNVSAKSIEDVTEGTTQSTQAMARIKINEGDKLVALTFDDGPYAPVTNKILDILEKNDAVATFFVVGNRVDQYGDCLKRANELGCEIGSHTNSHVNLTTLSVAKMQNEIKLCNDTIKKYTEKDVKIVRPPEGQVNDTVKANIGYPLILWSVDSKDWKHRNADKDYHEVIDYVKDGSIVLMHDLYPATAEAVAEIVPKLKADGYKFVTVSELMEYRGVTMENGHTYSSAKPTTQESTTSTETTSTAN